MPFVDFLKYVQNIDGSGAPRIAVVRSYSLEHAGAAKIFKWFGGGIGLAFLGGEQSMPNVDPCTARGKERKSLSDVPIQRMDLRWPFLGILLYV